MGKKSRPQDLPAEPTAPDLESIASRLDLLYRAVTGEKINGYSASIGIKGEVAWLKKAVLAIAVILLPIAIVHGVPVAEFFKGLF